MSDAAIGILTNLLGEARVITAPAELSYFATDIAGEAPVLPVMVVRPPSVDELCRTVRTLTDLGVAVVPRGAGYSYSGGTQCTTAAAIVDLTDLDRIIEINETDRFVTVETGCTWGALFAALGQHGLRTPFFGPLSGLASTIGGAASSNAWFFGSGAYGAMSDNVLSVGVVLADGSLIETGAAAAEGRSPFTRSFGPDFTGLFLGDCGTFGVKARITLPLIPVPAAEAYASFAFERFEDIAEAHAVLAHENVVAEQWGLDPEGNDALALQGFKFLEGVTFKHDPSPEYVARMNERLVVGHRNTLRGGYSLHVVVEGLSERDVETKIGRVRRLMLPMALKELPNAVPHLMRQTPFRGIDGLLGPNGENWLPFHGLFPFSKAGTIVAVTDEYFLRHEEEMAKHKVRVSTVTGTVGQAFVLEPMLLWHDRLHPFHVRHVTDAQQRFADTPEDRATREFVMRLRRDLIGLWSAFGASFLQIGRVYPYAETLSSASRAMTDAVKRALDPRGLMNPGVLQLGAQAGPRVSRKFAEFPQNFLEDRR